MCNLQEGVFDWRTIGKVMNEIRKQLCEPGAVKGQPPSLWDIR